MTRQDSPGIVHSITWNYVGYFYEMAVSVVLIAVIVRKIGVENYGLLVFASSVAGLLMLLGCGFSSVLVQAYVAAKSSKDVTRLNGLLSTAFWTLGLLGFVGFIACVLLSWWLPGPFRFPHELVPVAVAVLLLTGASVQLSLPASAIQLLFEASRRFDLLNQVQILVTTFRLIGTIALLAQGYGVVALAGIQVVGAGVRLLLLVYFLRRHLDGAHLSPKAVHWEVLRPIWRSGNWALLDNVSRQFAGSSDSLILGAVTSMGAVGIFGVGSRLPGQLLNLVSKGAAVIFPNLSEHHNVRETGAFQKLYLNTCYVTLTFLLPVVSLGIVLAGSIIETWAGAQYRAAAPVMRWLLLGALSYAMEFPADLVLYSVGRIGTAARISVVRTLASLAVGLLLVGTYGVTGWAAATAITHIAINVCWFIPTACRAVGLRPQTAAIAILRELALPVLFTPAALAVIFLLWLKFSPLHRVILGGGVGLLYIGIWSIVVAIPLWRGRYHLILESDSAA